jgi:hypothetical protein
MVTLTLAVMSDGTVDRDQLVGRVTGALKVSEAEAEARIAELTARSSCGSPRTIGRR